LFAIVALCAWTMITGLPFAPQQVSIPGVDTVTIPLVGASAGGSPLSALSATAEAAAATAAPAVAGWSARVALPNHGQMVGLTWDGLSDGVARVRGHSAQGWGEWLDLAGPEAMADHGEGNGKGSAGPAWLGWGTDAVEVAVDQGSLPNLALLSMHTETASRQGGAAFGLPTAGASIPVPAIVSRAEWGARPYATDVPGCGSAPLLGQGVFGAVVHHTVTSNSYAPDDAPAMIRGIQAFHMDGNGWCDIGYIFIVDRYGRAYEGRAGGITKAVLGAQVAGFNSVTTGIALLGQYQPGASPPAADVPPVQLTALRLLLAWKLGFHGVDPKGTVTATSQCSDENGGVCKFPAGTVVSFPAITGHRDLNNTSCPGSYAYAYLPQLANDVADMVVHSGPFDNLPGWSPATTGPRALVLDALGGLHPAGRAIPVAQSGYWPDLPIGRGITGTPTGGYVLDDQGGLHAYGSAPARQPSAYWPGWDIARGIAPGAIASSGYVLDGWGGVHPFGGAAALGGVTAYWPGWDIARGIVSTADGLGGYVLDGWGGAHPFGSAPTLTGGMYWYGWDIARAIALRPDGPGGYVLDGWGGLWPFGGAPSLHISRYTYGQDTMRALVLLPGGGGYALDANGIAWPLGNSANLKQSLTWTGYDLGRGIVASAS
jgi:hypothetical protein